MTLQEEIRQIGADAKNAALILAGESGAKRSNAVLAMADAIERHKTAILDANAIDLSNAKEAGLTDAMIDRLTLTDARFKSMVEGVRQVAALPDPLTHRLAKIHRPNGLEITKKTRTNRRHSNHLRISPKCHGGCRCIMLKIWQFCYSTRRERSNCDK